MIDFHSHILPAMDDGSRNVDESVALLNMLTDQGVETVVATPHFYANDESVDAFLERRLASYEQLQKALPQEAPRIVLGAEVRYYPGISRLKDLKRLCIGSSKLLLLEMPMSHWTEYTVKELVELSCKKDITLVLAHMERYWSLQKRDMWERLYECGILMQCNASFFLDFFTKRRALTMIKKHAIHFIGSDCHGIKMRPPRIGEAVEFIRKKASNRLIDQLIRYGESALGTVDYHI